MHGWRFAGRAEVRFLAKPARNVRNTRGKRNVHPWAKGARGRKINECGLGERLWQVLYSF